MNKERTQQICHEIIDKLISIIIECDNEHPYYGYLDEKLKPIENDIICIREEIEGSTKHESTNEE